VEELAEFGASVHICARNQDDINKCLEEWKGKGFCVTGSTCDLLFRDQREKLMETVASVFDGKLNILVRFHYLEECLNFFLIAIFSLILFFQFFFYFKFGKFLFTYLQMVDKTTHTKFAPIEIIYGGRQINYFD